MIDLFHCLARLQKMVEPTTADETFTYPVLQIQDITGYKQAGIVLAQKEAGYRSIFEAVLDGLVISDLDGTIAEVNPAFCTMHGYAREELTGLHLSACIHPDGHAFFEEYLQRARAGEAFQGRAVALRKDGTRFHVHVHGTPFAYRSEPYVLGTVRDLTGQVETRQILEERVAAQTRELALASIADQVGGAVESARLYEQAEALAVAEERQRLAREIHDTLAQGFTGIKLQLEAVESALEMQQTELALQRLSRARYLADQSLAEARRSVWALHSKSLEEKKLADALRDSVRGLTAGRGLAVTVAAQAGLPRFPTELETDLLRVAQEAVMNVVKHARARHLALQLWYKAGKVELHIEDDGRGFAVDGARVGREDSGGFGLTAMRERMVRHGGTLQVDSHPRRGTHIVACVEFPHNGA